MTKRLVIIFLPLLIWSCRDNNSLQSATPYFDSVLRAASKTEDSGDAYRALKTVRAARTSGVRHSITDDINCYSFYCDVYRIHLHNSDYAIAAADTMIRLLANERQTKKTAELYANACNRKADALFQKELFSAAVEYYFLAKKVAAENADSCSLSQFNYSIGIAMFRQKKFSESLKSFGEAFDETFMCDDNFSYFYRRQELLDNMGLCYERLLEFDSAAEYYKKTLAYIDSNYMRYDKGEDAYIAAKAVALGNLADVYVAQNSLDSAESLLTRSINMNLRKNRANDDAMTDQVKLAKIYLQTRRAPEMKQTLDRICAELDSIPDEQVKTSWNQLMWQYYNMTNDSAKAYKHLMTYETMNEALTAKNNMLLAADMSARLKNSERQYEISNLNEHIKLQKIYIFIAVLVIIMALVIVVLVARSANRTKNNLQQLTRLNNQVNEQKQKLELALAGLESKDKEKSKMLRSVAHDIMNPIAAIVSLADILSGEAGNLTEEQAEILKLMKEASANSLNLSRDILETARSTELAGQQLQRQPVDINKLVQNCVDLLSFQAAAKSQKILVAYAPGKVIADADKEKIWRIVNNLISNAIKFSYPNTEIRVAVTTGNGKVHISVKDTGVGIPEKNKSRIFDAFTDARQAGTSGEAPNGLGLSISLQLAKAHNGALWFESEEGHGATFHLEFPQAGTAA